MDIVLVSWIFWLLIGVLVGVQKDQLASGIIWSLLLGPLGVIIVLCLPNKKVQARERERDLQIRQQLDFQRRQLEELKKLSQPPTSESALPQKLRIAKNGQELGEMGVGIVKTMLNNGQLSREDLYLDPEANEWLPLEMLR